MYDQIFPIVKKYDATLLAVSKTKSNEEILKLYDLGQRDFGENKVQELVSKYKALPKDIQWHLIGHLQKNKVKYIAPFIAMIHSVDSLNLLQIIDKEAQKNQRVIPVLLQFFIAKEETKFGLTMEEAQDLLEDIKTNPLDHVKIRGVMGMASFTSDQMQIRSEFKKLHDIFKALKADYFKDKTYFDTLSMGMSSDYAIALEEGSTMVRIGSALFGARI